MEKGLKLEEGNLKGARYNLLKAAEFLYRAAEKSDATLKGKRIERAEGILRRAAGPAIKNPRLPTWA